jgi:hypothetical protein
MKKSTQLRRPSKKDMPEASLPRSDMNTRASGGDKESNEPLRRKLKGGRSESSTSRKSSR